MTPPSAASQPDARLDALTAWLRPLAERHALDLSTLAPASSDASFRRYFRVASANSPGGTLIASTRRRPKCREFVQVAQLLAAPATTCPRYWPTTSTPASCS
jgi:aminoglycoside/choline kinase family phosphotransferase